MTWLAYGPDGPCMAPTWLWPLAPTRPLHGPYTAPVWPLRGRYTAPTWPLYGPDMALAPVWPRMVQFGLVGLGRTQTGATWNSNWNAAGSDQSKSGTGCTHIYTHVYARVCTHMSVHTWMNMAVPIATQLLYCGTMYGLILPCFDQGLGLVMGRRRMELR